MSAKESNIQSDMHAWMKTLGTFERLIPMDAAARWGVSMKTALSRLHRMLGNTVEIIPDCIEVYRPATDMQEAVSTRQDARDAARAQRLAAMPDQGRTAIELAQLWGATPYATRDYLARLASGRYVESTFEDGLRRWRPTDKGREAASEPIPTEKKEKAA